MLVTTFTSASNVATDRYDHHHHHHHNQGGNDDNDDNEYTGIEGSEEEEFHQYENRIDLEVLVTTFASTSDVAANRIDEGGDDEKDDEYISILGIK